ncbi:unnamed protein product [Phytophthora lilii]|uniref:Unnamed protein product n=1 Tax=Phytophthora lilii TaxID=2077276 RepID=A0A9W6WUT0_9STRA|nr:unnamed protein product [Phytophthora lilii]
MLRHAVNMLLEHVVELIQHPSEYDHERASTALVVIPNRRAAVACSCCVFRPLITKRITAISSRSNSMSFEFEFVAVWSATYKQRRLQAGYPAIRTPEAKKLARGVIRSDSFPELDKVKDMRVLDKTLSITEGESKKSLKSLMKTRKIPPEEMEQTVSKLPEEVKKLFMKEYTDLWRKAHPKWKPTTFQ